MAKQITPGVLSAVVDRTRGKMEAFLGRGNDLDHASYHACVQIVGMLTVLSEEIIALAEEDHA
jgi:hypothetical protein